MNDGDAKKLIILWAHPRSRSTAFFRMMVERGDFLCIHEPFCTLQDTGKVTLDYKGETFSFCDFNGLMAFILQLKRECPVFIKETTDHRYAQVLANIDFLKAAKHSFLIRDLAHSILSHYKVNQDVSCAEIGCEHQHEIFMSVFRHTDSTPLVIDADILVKQPETEIQKFCSCFDIVHIPHSVQWSPDDLPHWKRTKRWHIEAAKSSGFRYEQKSSGEELTLLPHLLEYYNYHKPYFDELKSFSEKPARCE